MIPVKDGGPLLARVLEAVRAQGELELSWSTRLARRLAVEWRARRGAELIEIPPEEFGHGRTRNLARRARLGGELICFLTQDAVPEPGWLDAYREAFDARPARGRGVRPAPAAPRTRAR